MARRIITTDKAGRTRSPLSQAVKAGNLVWPGLLRRLEREDASYRE